MLYPIELLRQNGKRLILHGAWDGVHVNGQGHICHAIHRAFCTSRQERSVQSGPRRANCITAKSHHCKMQFIDLQNTPQVIVFKEFICS